MPVVPYERTHLSIVNAICSPYSTGKEKGEVAPFRGQRVSKKMYYLPPKKRIVIVLGLLP